MRVGIAGLGVMGRNHLRVLSGMPNVQEILVYDVADIEFQRNSNVQRVNEFSDLLSSGLDYVVVALPTALHLKFASELASARIPTLLEKPVALNLDEAREIQREFEAGGTICAVGHVERFNPAVAMLRREVRRGIIGKPHLYSTRRVGPYSGRIKDVGVVLDLATHDFDVIHFVSDQSYASISGAVSRPLDKEHEDVFLGFGRLDDGALVQHSVNWITPTKVREVSVLGDKGMLVADALRVELRLFKNGELGSEWLAYENLRGVSEGEEIKYVVPAREPLLLEHLAMAEELVKTGSTAICLIEDALRTMGVAEKMLKQNS